MHIAAHNNLEIASNDASSVPSPWRSVFVRVCITGQTISQRYRVHPRFLSIHTVVLRKKDGSSSCMCFLLLGTPLLLSHRNYQRILQCSSLLGLRFISGLHYVLGASCIISTMVVARTGPRVPISVLENATFLEFPLTFLTKTTAVAEAGIVRWKGLPAPEHLRAHRTRLARSARFNVRLCRLRSSLYSLFIRGRKGTCVALW